MHVIEWACHDVTLIYTGSYGDSLPIVCVIKLYVAITQLSISFELVLSHVRSV